MTAYPVYSELTTNTLQDLYKSIKKALAYDDAMPEGENKLYEVRSLPDWKKQADTIEA